MPKKLTPNEVLFKIKKRDSSIVGMDFNTYKNTSTPATFIDKDYGAFTFLPERLLKRGAHPIRVKEKEKTRMTLPIEEVERRVFLAHRGLVTIDPKSYIKNSSKALFIDKEYGKWFAVVSTVCAGHEHPSRAIEKSKTSIEEVEKRIYEKHGDKVKIIRETYKSVGKQAKFIDISYGEWQTEVKSVLKGRGHPKRGYDENVIPALEIQKRIQEIHEGRISIVESTYVNTQKKALFIDKELGDFLALVNNVLKGLGHPKRRAENYEKTCLEKFGTTHPAHNREFALKVARSSNLRHLRIHWKTGEELVCQASWEPKVVDYLNTNKIDFLWQPQVFKMPNGKTYRPDMFLVNENKWVEIKGWMRPNSKIKWDWFQSEYPNSELWDKKRLKELGINI